MAFEPRKLDNQAMLIAEDVVEIAGVKMPLDEYLKNKEKELHGLELRESELRRQITKFIKNHFNSIIILQSLDWQSQCRQLSWHLYNSGNQIIHSFPKPNYIAKIPAECYVFTHYIRAFAAAVLDIKPEYTIKQGENPKVERLAEVADSNEQILTEKIRLWIYMTKMIPKDTEETRKIFSIQESLERIEAGITYLINRIKQGY